MSGGSRGPGWWQASDGRWYPPQPGPGAPPAPPAPQWGGPPSKGSNTGCLIALAVVGGLLVLGVVTAAVLLVVVGREVDDRVDEDGITTFSGNDENPPADDVSVAGCGPAPETGFMQATVDVRNHSSEPSNYVITVAFEDEGGGRQFTTSTAFVNGLGADQTTSSETDSFQEPPNGAAFTCRISRVERFAA